MAQIPVDDLTAAARALMRAGRWSTAEELLAAARADDPREAAALAVTRADVAVDEDFFCGTSRARSLILQEIPPASSDQVAFDAEFLRLRHDYAALLFSEAAADPGAVASLAERGARLAAQAPDPGRAAMATFYVGVIEENLGGDSAAATPRYEQAIDQARRAGDGLAESYPLRHLGGQAADRGEPESARQLWERATLLRMRAGTVPHVLAQLVLLAQLSHDAGDAATASVLATVVRDWADALGANWLKEQASTLLAAPLG